MMSDDLIHFEDIVVGTEKRFGHYEVTREEVIAYAQKFDPQPFHLDDEAAAQTHFGRLAASGLHTAAMMNRMMIDGDTGLTASLGGGGMDQLRFAHPVYPGDTLSIVKKVLGKRRSTSRPDMGIEQHEISVLNQDGVLVMRHIGIGFIRVRHPEAPVEE